MGKYDSYSKEQLIGLLERRDRERRFGLVWERDEIEADAALNDDFVTFDPDPALHAGAAPHRNLIIEGDNFDALRALRLTHRGRIKCIYIDPPYNTGNKDWVYNDRYVAKEDRYRHSLWLEFMYRRLTLARDLLREDGVLMVSIDDTEAGQLRCLLDQVFERDRFVATLVWRRRKGAAPTVDHFIATNHEYVLVYAKEAFAFRGLEKEWTGYSNPDDDPLGPWSSADLTLGFNKDQRPNLFYPLHDPRTDRWFPCNANRVWVYASRHRLKAGQQTRQLPMEDLIEQGRVLFPDGPTVRFETREALIDAIQAKEVPLDPRGNPLIWEDMPDLDFWVGKTIGFGTPRFKRHQQFLQNAYMPLSSWLRPASEKADQSDDDGPADATVGDSSEGTRVLRKLFGETPFSYPKPLSLLTVLIQQSTAPGDTVLDFFAGSGTTAHAVMQLNAQDGGDRRWIMVSSTEATAQEPEKNLARDVLRERIARAAAAMEVDASATYLRCRRISGEDLPYELTPAECWRLIRLRHGIPLDDAPPTAPLATAGPGTEAGETVCYLDSVTSEAMAALADLAEDVGRGGPPVVVYAWTVGPLRDRFGGRVQLREVPADLEKGHWR